MNEVYVTKDCKRLTDAIFLDTMGSLFTASDDVWDYIKDYGDMRVGDYKYNMLKPEVKNSSDTFKFARSGVNAIDLLYKETEIKEEGGTKYSAQ